MTALIRPRRVRPHARAGDDGSLPPCVSPSPSLSRSARCPPIAPPLNQGRPAGGLRLPPASGGARDRSRDSAPWTATTSCNARPLLDNQRLGWWCPDAPGSHGRSRRGEVQGLRRHDAGPSRVDHVPAAGPGAHRARVGRGRYGHAVGRVRGANAPECSTASRSSSALAAETSTRWRADSNPASASRSGGAFLLDAETRLNPGVAASYFGAGRAARDEPVGPASGKSISPERGVCPVTGKPLGSMGPPVTVTINGRTVELCCEGLRRNGCGEAPEKYLSRPKSP